MIPGPSAQVVAGQGGSRALLAWAGAELAAAGVPSPTTDAELLAEHVTGVAPWRLRMGQAVTAVAAAEFARLVALRAARVPLQHLTGRAYFRHLELAVGPGVFIPRPETELLVDAVAEAFGRRPRAGLVLVDLCSGSAALAISLATEFPGSTVLAVEADAAALGWAQRNAEAHADRVAAVGSRLVVVGGDATTAADPGGVLAQWCGQVDAVVSNPPYIPAGAVPRDPEVRDHDPALALYGGPDGLAVVRLLSAQACALLAPGGLLVVEHADTQGEEPSGDGPGVPGLLRNAVGPAWLDVADHRDLAGRPRYTTARRA